jgi:nucleoside-diphosphate-sugar epimerase
MSLCLVTGVAGFIGSTLAERLLADGHTVRGVDCFVEYYPRPIKQKNLTNLLAHPNFCFIEKNLATDELVSVVRDVEFVFHQAGQAGVLPSWGQRFDSYVTNNITATQRLLEAVREKPLHKFLFASSSTIYGEARELPVRETALPHPIVPYGVTKLAAEHLVNAYHDNFGLPTIILRYFSVYGPRQRPDIAFHKFIDAIAHNHPIRLRGDGEQTRDATFVSDVVEANVLAMQSAAHGEIFNIGGGERATINHIIHLMEQIIERPALIERAPTAPGEMRHTWADTTRARDLLHFTPHTSLYEGLHQQIEWQLANDR